MLIKCLIDGERWILYNKEKAVKRKSAIKTYTGIMFDPLEPNMDLIRIEDIAHALSLLCRANGHFRSFYSVGQHCINCAEEATARGFSARVQLGCLIHDGSEAYLSDVTRPVKKALPKYLEIEEPLQNAIWNKWLKNPLAEEEIEQIFEIDDMMLYNEFMALMDTALVDDIPVLLSNAQFVFRGFKETKEAYLSKFKDLCIKLCDKVGGTE